MYLCVFFFLWVFIQHAHYRNENLSVHLSKHTIFFSHKRNNKHTIMAANEEQLSSISDCFMLFDKDSDGNLTQAEFKTAVRALGSIGGFPTEQELSALFEQNSSDGKVNQQQFKGLMQARVEKFNSEGGVQGYFDQTENPFKVLDMKNSGKIDESELKNVLTTLADKLNEAEYDKLLQITGIQVQNGEVDYNQLYSSMVKLLSQ